MADNPLTIPILQLLKQKHEGISEYELIKYLQLDSDDFPDFRENDLAMFHANFLVMNALYQLQEEMWLDGYYLSISSLKIKLESVSGSWESRVPVEKTEDAVREYYLDWNNYHETNEADVKALLEQFWQRFYAVDKREAALTTLGLPENADWQSIKTAYRKLVAQTHPDRGGDADQFISIREAYERLKFLR